jgi:hypothetical protein
VKKQRRTFPPPCLSDLEDDSAGAFLKLSRGLREQQTTLVFGSGVSASAGLPIWRELLIAIGSAFFEHWYFEKSHGRGRSSPPRDLSIAFWEEVLWSEDAVRLATDFSKGDPLLVAQQIKNCIRDIDWRYLLNKSLYSGGAGIYRSVIMEELASLCETARAIRSIVNFNYDDIFEDYLAEKNILASVNWSLDSHNPTNAISIIHPHGYLKRGGGPVTQLVVSEEDYFQHARTPYAWPDITLISLFTQSMCVFIGHSMTDPNVRRLLRLARLASSRSHFAFLPKPYSENERDAMLRNLFDVDLAKLGVRSIRFSLKDDKSSSYSRLSELLNLLKCSIDRPGAIWDVDNDHRA